MWCGVLAVFVVVFSLVRFVVWPGVFGVVAFWCVSGVSGSVCLCGSWCVEILALLSVCLYCFSVP